MNFNKLGKTDIEVSEICLGTMTFGEQNTESEGHEQLSYAKEQGVNFIDTAELYSVPGRKETQGSTERIVGSWLKGEKREDFILATKCTGPSAGLKYIREDLNFSKKHLNIALEGSLKRLQTDYIDLYQLHWPERKANFFGKLGYTYDESDQWKDNFMEVLETLDGFIKSGKVRHIGLSNETAWGAMKFLGYSEAHDLERVQTIQNPYNLLNRSYEVGLAEVSMREDVGLLAYSPLAFGILSGKYLTGEKHENSRIALFPQLARYNAQQCYDATNAYNDVAKKHGLSLTQMSLAFVNQQPFVASNIIGATTMDQLKENIASQDIVLSEEVLKDIEAVHKIYTYPAP